MGWFGVINLKRYIMGNNVSAIKYKTLLLTYPRENKMLQRKFAEPRIDPKQLGTLARKA